MKELVAITGCDSGIGRSLASACLKRGWAVAVSYLEENPFTRVPDVHARQLDLRVEGEADTFAEFVRERCAEGHALRALVDNAGVALGGPFENLPMALYREAFEVNFFGLVRLSQRLLPELVAAKGKLVVVGSLAGRIALPFLSPYTSTKYALEGFCDSVRRELLPFGVRTVLLEVAGVATPIWNKALKQDVSFMDPRYAASMEAFKLKFIAEGNYGLEVDRAAERIARILALKAPRDRYLISKSPLLDRLKMRIPGRLLDRVLLRTFEMTYSAGGPRGDAGAVVHGR